MAKTLSFTDTSPQTVKIGDTTTSFTLICGNDNVATDLTKATSITVKLGNASGYLKSATVDPASLTDPTTGQVTVNFNADLMTSLTAGSYSIEVWVVDNTGTSIYPSDGSTGFAITNNIQSTNGSVITTITFDDFVAAMNKAASTIAKGDKGSGVWSMKIAAGGNVSGRWVTDLYNASRTNIPAVNDLVIQPDGNVFSVINVAKTTQANSGGYTFDIGPVLYNIKGDTGSVDNAGLTTAPAFVALKAQVDNSAVGTNLLLGTSKTLKTVTNASGWNTNLPSNLPSVTKVNSDTSYTARAWISPASYDMTVQIAWKDVSGIWQYGNGSIISAGTSGYSTWTGTITAGSNIQYVTTIFNTRQSTASSVSYCEIKLELGSHATDWCPNPSEILTQSDYAKIKAAIVALGGSLS
ncbi:collagen-like protein [Lactiplantibacillus plantarum]|uniref:collagen-like protein n=1 Tax=Lactiplantibacillus plantarum TaxID=1590 RepID=UPI003F52B69E